MPPTAAPDAATAGGFLLVLALAGPPAAALVAFVAGGRQVARIALGTAALGLALAVAIAGAVPRAGGGSSTCSVDGPRRSVWRSGRTGWPRSCW